MSVLHVIGLVLLMAGAGFAIVSAVGVLRFPDFFTRVHAAGIADTLGSLLVLTGLMFYSDSLHSVIKLLLILFFLLFTTPTAAHALAKAALHGGETPFLKRRGSNE